MVSLVFALTGCATAAGAGVGAALVTVGLLTHECYEYVYITVVDGTTGAKTCDATVTAQQDDDSLELGSCYYAPLTEGKWTLRAELPGRPAVTTPVEARGGCDPAVATVVLTIPAAASAAPVPAPAPAAPPAPPAPAAPAPATPEASPPPAPGAAPVESSPPAEPPPAAAPAAPTPAQ